MRSKVQEKWVVIDATDSRNQVRAWLDVGHLSKDWFRT